MMEIILYWKCLYYFCDPQDMPWSIEELEELIRIGENLEKFEEELNLYPHQLTLPL